MIIIAKEIMMMNSRSISQHRHSQEVLPSTELVVDSIFIFIVLVSEYCICRRLQGEIWQRVVFEFPLMIGSLVMGGVALWMFVQFAYRWIVGGSYRDNGSENVANTDTDYQEQKYCLIPTTDGATQVHVV